MERVRLTDFSRTKGRQFSQHVCDCVVFARGVGWLDEFDRSKARCDYDYPAAMLRNAVIRAVHHPLLWVLSEMETFFGENGHEVIENFVTLEFGDILHAHDIGFRLPDEPAEVPEQSPFRVTVVLEPLRIFRKRLARCTSDEDARVTLWVLTGQVAASELGYAFLVKYHSSVVVFIWESTHIVYVVTGRYFHTCVQEPASQPTGSTKKVDCCCGYFRRFSHLLLISIVKYPISIKILKLTSTETI